MSGPQPLNGTATTLNQVVQPLVTHPTHQLKRPPNAMSSGPLIKRQRTDPGNASKVIFRNPVQVISNREVPRVGRLREKEFYESDGTDESDTITLETSLTQIQRTRDDDLAVCAFFASALVVYLPSIRTRIISTLMDIGVRPNTVHLPEQADEIGLVLQNNDEYDPCDSNVIMGVCICLLYKNIDEKSYTNFSSSRMNALAGKLGMTKRRMTQLRLPLTLKQAEVVRGKLGADNSLKREILLYLMELADKGGYVGATARYVCMILSWNEMAAFTFVYEKLCQTASPVLRESVVRAETIKFAEAMGAVARCEYPQFFRYFCSAEEEQLISRNRFPILAAVAHSVKNAETNNPTTANFVSTMADTEGVVGQLVRLHNEYMDRVNMGDTKAYLFMTKDPGVHGFNDEDDS